MRDIVVNDEKCQKKKANKIHPETNNIIFFSRMYSELHTLLAPFTIRRLPFLASLARIAQLISPEVQMNLH